MDSIRRPVAARVPGAALRPHDEVALAGFDDRYFAEDVITRSRALDVPIYTMSIVSPLDDPRSEHFVGEARPGSATKGADVLARYAAMSGGGAFVVSDFRRLKLAADRIIGELAHQYRLGYGPPAGPPRFRRVQIRTSRSGVVVKTRSGYLPRP